MKLINQRRYSYIPYPQCTDQPDDPYGKNGTVRSGGCGLCSTCMIVDHLTTEELSVRECTELSIATGANHGDGTDMHILGPVVAEKFNLDFKKTNDIEEVVKALHNGGGVVATVTAHCEGNKGIFTSFGHYIALVAADENDEITVLDPSWRAKKFNKWVKAGLVREEGNVLYVTPEVLHAETNPKWTTYFIFSRKKRTPDL